MQNKKQFQYRYLEKIIESCELANGLAQSMSTLSKRDLKLSVKTLHDRGYELPRSMRLVVSKKVVEFLSEDLRDTLQLKEVRQKKQAPLIAEFVDIMSVWKTPDQAAGEEMKWTFARPLFAALAVELAEQIQDEDMDMSAALSEETQQQRAALNQEFQDIVFGAITNTAFMQLFDNEDIGPKRELLLRVSEAYVKAFNDDKVREMESDRLLPAARAVAENLADVFVSLTMLLNPGNLESNIAAVSKLVGGEAKSQNKLESAVALCLSTASWQKLVDEVITTAPATMKHAGTVRDMCEGLAKEMSSSDVAVTDELRRSVQKLSELKRVLRPGATRSLEDCLQRRLQEVGTKTLEKSDVEGLPADHVRVVLQGLRLFSGNERSLLELELKIMDWSARMSKQLGWKNLAEIRTSLLGVAEDAELIFPYEEIKEVIEAVGDSGTDTNFEDLQLLTDLAAKDLLAKAG
ncbi:unnamed protein product [Symbiodinium sp. CCMP2592]|nr:unnamed protein product [Symbiodinium sp. CCMP2592]CAE7252707.1 unnamed protein product [Symbiodinium sp. CCMP2592]